MYRYNPAKLGTNESPLSWDAPEATIEFGDFKEIENRYQMLSRSNPAEAERLAALAAQDNAIRTHNILNLKNS